MKKKFNNKDLQYVYEKLLRLQRDFREFEKLVYNWKQKDDKIIDKLRKSLGGLNETI